MPCNKLVEDTAPNLQTPVTICMRWPGARLCNRTKYAWPVYSNTKCLLLFSNA